MSQVSQDFLSGIALGALSVLITLVVSVAIFGLAWCIVRAADWLGGKV